MKERVIGIVLVFAGLALGYVGAVMPLMDAAEHKDSVTLYMKAVGLCPILLVFGLIYLLMGEKTNDLFGQQGSRTPLFWIVGAVTLGAGFGAYFWVQSALESAGYKF